MVTQFAVAAGHSSDEMKSDGMMSYKVTLD